jgi:hypothetical protein
MFIMLVKIFLVVVYRQARPPGPQSVIQIWYYQQARWVVRLLGAHGQGARGPPRMSAATAAYMNAELARERRGIVFQRAEDARRDAGGMPVYWSSIGLPG